MPKVRFKNYQSSKEENLSVAMSFKNLHWTQGEVLWHVLTIVKTLNNDILASEESSEAFQYNP